MLQLYIKIFIDLFIDLVTAANISRCPKLPCIKLQPDLKTIVYSSLKGGGRK